MPKMAFVAVKYTILALLVVTTAQAATKKHQRTLVDLVDQDEAGSKRSYDLDDGFGQGRRFRFPDDDPPHGDREFTVGAHYSVAEAPNYNGAQRVQPGYIDSFRKHSNLRQFDDDYSEYTPRHAKSKKFKKQKLFKPTPAIPSVFDSIHSTENVDEFQIHDPDPGQFKANFKLQEVPNLYDRPQNYEEIASKGQIEQFLEDQQKLIDEQIELQLLNDPSPSAKGRYHQFLKAKDDERIEKEYVEKQKKDEEEEYRHSSQKYLRAPKDPFADRKPSSEEISFYRPPVFQGTYSFELDI